MTFEQCLDMQLAQWVSATFAAVLQAGQRDYLASDDIDDICDAASTTPDRVAEVCHRAGIKVVP
jgi:hypothetical protein